VRLVALSCQDELQGLFGYLLVEIMSKIQVRWMAIKEGAGDSRDYILGYISVVIRVVTLNRGSSAVE
jgi:hypothetical protein